MNLSKIFMAVCFWAIAIMLPASVGHAQGVPTFDQNKFYRFTTKFTGMGKSLDVINDGKNNQVHLAKTGNFTGQAWKITPVGNGLFRLTTQFQGAGKSLDVVNDGKNNRVHLANTGEYSGQFWKITPLGNGFYRLTSQWQGPGKSLDVVNDGKNNQVILDKTGNYTGQMWRIVAASTPASGGRTPKLSKLLAGAKKSLGSSLSPGSTMTKGTQITCPNKRYSCRFQADGNLAVYGPNNTYIWDAKTGGKGDRCVLQSDGNLVIYDRNNKACWSSETMSYFDRKYASRDWKPVKFEINDSGVCGLKSATGRVVWTCKKGATSSSTSSTASTAMTSLRAGQTMRKGSSITCPNRSYNLRFQTDGNLALYGPGDRYMWDAKTNGKGETCVLQSDGNLVVYDRNQKAVWSTETMAYFDRKFGTRDWKPVKLEISNAGMCALKSSTGRVAWSCGNR